MSASQIKSWIGYQGFTRISETEFYSIAGYQREALEATKFAKTTSTMVWGGFGVAMAGLGIMLLTMNDFSSLGLYGGGVLVIGGSIPMLIGAYRTNWSTVGNAISVAEEYNIRLKKKIESSAK